MTEINDILEGLSGRKATRAPRVSKPKVYGDLVWNSRAKVGDVVYMPSAPDVKMTVVKLPNVNHAAHTFGRQYEVQVQWLDANGHLTGAAIVSDALLKD
jgi:hypothetical protein